jgi:hypothetical protein
MKTNSSKGGNTTNQKTSNSRTHETKSQGRSSSGSFEKEHPRDANGQFVSKK